MNKDDVIRLATHARLPYDYDTGEPVWLDKLTEFAKLVAEHERREFGQVLFDYAGRDDLTFEEEALLKHLYEILRAKGQE